MKKGKLIVIDGADGSGKATQTKLLREALLQKGIPTEQTDFPRYKDNFFGGLIGGFQTDETIGFSKIHPLLASIPYAADRFESKPQLEAWLNAGTHVISDRYVSANQLHQGGKIADTEERRIFLEKLDYMEHVIFGIPRPDLIILLNVPHHISLRLMKEKNSTSKKEYSRRKTDFVEQDEEYQLNARESGIKMLTNESWFSINCSEDGETLIPVEVIHQKILERCLKIL
jgi:dTMP kinase